MAVHRMRIREVNELHWNFKNKLANYMDFYIDNTFKFTDIKEIMSGNKIEDEIKEFIGEGYTEIKAEEIDFHEAETDQEINGIKKYKKSLVKAYLYGVLGLPGTIFLLLGLVFLIIGALGYYLIFGPIIFGVLALIGLIAGLICIGNPFRHVVIQKTLIINAVAYARPGRRKYSYAANVYIPDKKYVIRNVPITCIGAFRAKRNLVMFIAVKDNGKASTFFG